MQREFSVRLFPVYSVQEDPVQQMASRLLLFTKIGPSVDHIEVHNMRACLLKFLLLFVCLFFCLKSWLMSAYIIS